MNMNTKRFPPPNHFTELVSSLPTCVISLYQNKPKRMATFQSLSSLYSCSGYDYKSHENEVFSWQLCFNVSNYLPCDTFISNIIYSDWSPSALLRSAQHSHSFLSLIAFLSFPFPTASTHHPLLCNLGDCVVWCERWWVQQDERDNLPHWITV